MKSEGYPSQDRFVALLVLKTANKRPVGLYSSAEFYAGSATEAIFSVRISQESIKYCRSSSDLNETWMKIRPKNKKIQISKICKEYVKTDPENKCSLPSCKGIHWKL